MSRYFFYELLKSTKALSILGYCLLLVSAFNAPPVQGAASFPDRLLSGENLAESQTIKSGLGRTLLMQSDGNLALYNGSGRPVWDAGTQGNPGAWFAMQGDGNLVIYGPEIIVPIWDSNTAGNPGAWLTMQGDGNLVVYNTAGNPLWSSGTQGNPDAWYSMQGDGNLVVYSADNQPLWSSGTAGNPGAWLQMQDDGNLVIYKKTNLPLWTSDTQGNPGAWLSLQSDGNLVLYSTEGQALWASNTVDGWMAMLGDTIAPKKLTELVIPGTHESATFNLNDQRWGDDNNIDKTIFDLDRYLNPSVSFEDVWETSWDCGWSVFQWICDAVQTVSKKPVFTFHADIIEGLAEAQTLTITQQLELGIRYFDFRTISDNGNFYAVHALEGDYIYKFVDEIRDYLDKYDKEIVILDFKLFYKMENFDHARLINYLKKTFGRKIVDWDDGNALKLTVEQLWADSKQVVVLYQGPSQPLLWESGTNDLAVARLKMNTNGNLEILTNSPKLWESGTGGNPTAELRMLDNGNLVVERPPAPVILWQSDNTARYPGATYRMQADGNLVINDVDGKPIWSTGTHGNPGASYEMQADGNLVVKDMGGTPLWSSNTPGNPGATLEIIDGNLVIFSPPKPKAIWQTGTAGHLGAELIMQDDGNLVLYSEPLPEAIWSSNTQGNPGAWLTMQGDGNLVVYGPEITVPIWSSGTAGNPGAWLSMQGDGNLVIYNTVGDPLWSSGTGGNSGAWQSMQDDGNLVVYSVDNEPLWSSGTAGNPDAWLQMQDDGNLVIYKKTHLPLWSSGTAGNPGAWRSMQSDGNLVVYSVDNEPLWSSGTAGNPEAWLQMQDDGNLVIYKMARRALWASNTGGYYGATYEMQADGNLAVRAVDNTLLWASNTYGHPGAQLIFEANGNLVIYSTILWESGTDGNPNATYAFEDGNLIIKDAAGAQLWESGTGGNPSATLENEAGNIVVRGDILFPAVAWSTNTGGNPGAWYSMQGDGNLVVYSADGSALWASNTQGNPDAMLKLPRDGDSNMTIAAPPSNFWVYSNDDDNIIRSKWPNKEFLWDLIPSWSEEVDTIARMKTDGTLKGLWVLQGVATPNPKGIKDAIKKTSTGVVIPLELAGYLSGLKFFAHPATIALHTKLNGYHKTAGLNIVICDFPEVTTIVDTLIRLNGVPTNRTPPTTENASNNGGGGAIDRYSVILLALLFLSASLIRHPLVLHRALESFTRKTRRDAARTSRIFHRYFLN